MIESWKRRSLESHLKWINNFMMRNSPWYVLLRRINSWIFLSFYFVWLMVMLWMGYSEINWLCHYISSTLKKHSVLTVKSSQRVVISVGIYGACLLLFIPFSFFFALIVYWFQQVVTSFCLSQLQIKELNSYVALRKT